MDTAVDIPARRATRSALAWLASIAHARGRQAPSREWLASLANGERHVGVITGGTRGGWVVAAWAGVTAEGDRAGALLEVRLAEWMALEAHAVPAPVQAWARELAARG